MRRYLPALLLALAAFAPFPLAGCDLIDKLKAGKADAGDDAAATTAAPVVDADAGVVPPVDTATATADAATPVAPTTTGTVRPVVVTDAGVRVDAAAPIVDAGAKPADAGPAPAPTPTLKLPGIDGGFLRFDAGGLKLPFPTK